MAGGTSVVDGDSWGSWSPMVDGTPDAGLGAALAPVERDGEGRLAVAARELGHGHAVWWGGGLFVAASVMKVNILAALLLRARTEGLAVTCEERALAAAMIERSDNEAANALWTAIGGAPGLAAANLRLGPRRTDPDRTGRWGLSRTTAADQLALLGAVHGEGSPLAPQARAYMRELMGRVVETQRWGISAAGDGTAAAELKNGWLPRTATGLWAINSVGRVRACGRTYLLAVLSDGHSTRARGIETVEEAARAAVRVLRSGPRGAAGSVEPGCPAGAGLGGLGGLA
ncbi:serine hydrolase [Streptomyces iconiensis]|uniref:Serine hydrolase n=1 Tax=Streptomyces iconiensis TaxID=1384038 RepID=A0ABT6ZT76_9ACTN|nr:serine hydrolase [Streptomyces iconiensis]MDJ1132254.1 serine hydrolase [Streptomyces iconiensis]